ncbi:galactose-specific lectin nattectin-like [Patiria miniata]|uniref:C-type lectin domain-containing protein n=1 Tax=Patiria miniata TaxID=46514 RepID=A0A914AYU2_PATMI|nr:galactose-specific lectin nattectin-like [Patiria miniata]
MAWWTARFVLILVSIFINLPSCQALYASCPPGWLKWQQSCYIRLPNRMNWFEASEACNRPGSSLAVPNSREENDFIWKSVGPQTNGMWIGCTDAAQEGIWLCGGQPLAFSNWYPGNPLTDNQRNCARMTIHDAGGLWSDNAPCGSKNRKHAACEMTVSAMPAYHTFTGPDGRVPQRCLLHHDIKNLTAEGVLDCGWACRADPRCRSFNLWQSSKREKMCQLNDVIHLGADVTDYKATNNCYYFEL